MTYFYATHDSGSRRFATPFLCWTFTNYHLPVFAGALPIQCPGADQDREVRYPVSADPQAARCAAYTGSLPFVARDASSTDSREGVVEMAGLWGMAQGQLRHYCTNRVPINDQEMDGDDGIRINMLTGV